MKKADLIPHDQLPGWREAIDLMVDAFELCGWGGDDFVEIRRAPKGLRLLVRQLERLVRGLLLALALNLKPIVRRAGDASALPQTQSPDYDSQSCWPGLRLMPPDHHVIPPNCAQALFELRVRLLRDKAFKPCGLIRRLLALEEVLRNPLRPARRLARLIRKSICTKTRTRLVLPPYNWPQTQAPIKRVALHDTS